MTAIDYILLALAAGVLVYQINLLLRSKREILIPGTPPNRKAVLVLVLIILALAIFRTDNLRQSWPVFLIMAVVCMTIFVGGCGVGNRGMFSSGRYISFVQAVYYEINDKNGQKLFRLSRMTRETQMLVSADKLPEIIAIMEENHIPEYSEYTKKMSKRAGDRAAAQARKSQNKKKKKK